MPKSCRFSGLVVAASALLTFAPLSAAISQDAYSECTCVTAPGSYSDGVGQISVSSGDVLLNNAGASSGEFLPASSEIMVGSGSATYNVGATCSDVAGANTIVLISQPAGPNSNLCVKVSSMDADLLPLELEVAASSVGVIALLGVLGGGAAGAALLLDDDSNDIERPPASN